MGPLRSRFGLTAGVAAIATVGLVAGCTSNKAHPSASGTATNVASIAKCPGFPSGGDASKLEAVGHSGGNLVEGHPSGGLGGFNPLAGGFEPWEYTTWLIFDKLVDINPDTRLPYPNLADEVPTRGNGGISADGLTYTFKLRSGVKWADGTPFTASDVAYEYDLLQNPKVGSPFTSSVQDRIASVTATNPTTVVFHLKHVVASFLIDNMYGIAPKETLSKYQPSQLADSAFAKGDAAQTFGTGPFRFGQIKNGGNTVVLNRSPHYFCGTPALAHYVYTSTSDFASNLQLLINGQIDVGQITPTDLDRAKQAGLQTFSYETVFSTNLLFNLDQSHATSDRSVRQALMYGIDQPALIQGVGGGNKPVNGVLSPDSFAYTEDVHPAYSIDLQKAQDLLTAAGWTKDGSGQLTKDGKPLSVAIWTDSGNPTRDNAAAILQQDWKALGIQVSVKTEDAAALQNRYQKTKNYDVAIIGLYHDLDPDDMSQFYSTSGSENYNGYSNSKVDQLVQQGLSTLDPAQRTPLYQQAQDLIAQDVPMPALWFNGNVRAETSRVHNIMPNGITLDVNRWNGAWWWVNG